MLIVHRDPRNKGVRGVGQMKTLALAVMLGAALCWCETRVMRVDDPSGHVAVFSTSSGSIGDLFRYETDEAICFVLIGSDRGGVSCIPRQVAK